MSTRESEDGMNHDENRPAEASPPTLAKKEGNKNSSTGLILIAIVFLCSAVLFYWTQIRERTNEVPQIVFIDVVGIQLAKKRELEQTLPTYAEIMSEVDEFSSQLQEILDAYREAGVIVLSESIVLAAPGQFDITQAVANHLNVQLATSRPE